MRANKYFIFPTILFLLFCTNSKSLEKGYTYYDNEKNILVCEIPLKHSVFHNDIKKIEDISDYYIYLEIKDSINTKTSQLFFRPKMSIDGLPVKKESLDIKTGVNFKIENYFLSKDKNKIIVIISNDSKKIKDIDIAYMYFHLLDEERHPTLMRNTDTIKIFVRSSNSPDFGADK